VASDRTVAPVATCARVAPAMCHNFVIHQRRSTDVSNAQLRRRALAKPHYYSTSMFSGILTTDINGRAIWLRSWAGNTLVGAASLGTVGLDWQLGGFAADPPSGSAGDASQAAQLTQATAGFTGSSGAGESLNAAPPGADTSQQTLLTTPQHA
jgi:hypothetical protein